MSRPAASDRPPADGRAPGWSDQDLARLAMAFETFVLGGAGRRASLASAALTDVADPADLRLLRLVLRGLDSRLVNLALGAGPVRFRDLMPERRERLLLGWGTSRLGRRRTAFQTLKRLACFLAYADPGPDGENPHWRRIAYERAEEPVTTEPPAIRPIEHDAAHGRALELEADVVIVGSGAGGGAVADALARAGRDVLVVEAGSYVPEASMPRHELDGFDRLYLDHGMTATADLGIAILAGRTLGGGTVVNWTTSIAPPEPLRHAWARDHGLEGFDGPDTDADLTALADELGLAPPPTVPPKDRTILAGAQALGWEAALVQRDASGCGDCGSCGFGCPRAAKHAGPRAHLASAVRAGARVLVDATVDRVMLEHGRAAGVRGHVVAPGGGRAPFVVHARRVVVAAGALRTPAILRRSGLTNASIGAWLRLHPVAVVAGRLADPVEMWRGTTQAAAMTQFASPGPASGDGPGPAHGGFIVEAAPAHPGLIALAFPWESALDHRASMDRVRFFAPLIGIVADRGSGRVRPIAGGRVRIEYTIGAEDRATARRALVEMARLARAAGSTEMVALGTPAAWFGRTGSAAHEGTAGERAWRRYLETLASFDFSPNRGFLFSAHQMGSARAGSDPRSTACDPWGRVRADDAGAIVEGLYVADSSLFPTASGVNPMMTVVTLAKRVARTILAETTGS